MQKKFKIPRWAFTHALRWHRYCPVVSVICDMSMVQLCPLCCVTLCQVKALHWWWLCSKIYHHAEIIPEQNASKIEKKYLNRWQSNVKNKVAFFFCFWDTVYCDACLNRVSGNGCLSVISWMFRLLSHQFMDMSACCLLLSEPTVWIVLTGLRNPQLSSTDTFKHDLKTVLFVQYWQQC